MSSRLNILTEILLEDAQSGRTQSTTDRTHSQSKSDNTLSFITGRTQSQSKSENTESSAIQSLFLWKKVVTGAPEHSNKDNEKPFIDTSERIVFYIFTTFNNVEDENMYRCYRMQEKKEQMPTFVLAMLIYLLTSIALEAPVLTWERVPRVVVLSLGCGLGLLLLALLRRFEMRDNSALVTLVFVLLWSVLITVTLINEALTLGWPAAHDTVGCIVITIFTAFMALPLDVVWCIGLCVCLSVVDSILEGISWILVGDQVTLLPQQVEGSPSLLSYCDLTGPILSISKLTANMLLFLGTIALGVLLYAFVDRKQRRSFLETKSSLRLSIAIEKEYKEQERLLLSMLPKHVADEMIRDMGTGISGQFRKIYMSRHENVSILFADIVGFTAISSAVTAAELVKLLNKLFASFDKQANKYHQCRIKILGDCYYCVCGAIESRPDHAVLSIHMGLSMIDIIREVRNSTNKDVNMRVGIHTGAVLGGVLGQRQWQFDVLGKEVTLANKMESGGLPARVHISEATRGFLHDEFELEPGNGGDREEYIRFLGINTYLVKAVLKPFPQGTLDEGKSAYEIALECGEIVEKWKTSAEKSRYMKEMDVELKKALANKINKRVMADKTHRLTLWFRDAATEIRYQERRGQYNSLGMVGLCIVLAFTVGAKLCVLPRTIATILTFVIGESILIFMAVLSISTSFLLKLPKRLTNLAMAIERNQWSSHLWGILAIIILFVISYVQILQCEVEDAVSSNHSTVLDPDDPNCVYPEYFVYSIYVILLGMAFTIQLRYLIRILLIVICLLISTFQQTVEYAALFNYYDTAVYSKIDGIVSSRYRLSLQLIAGGVMIILFIRKIEETSRRMFLWWEDARAQSERATDLRRKNEALVYNILPSHIARDFMGRQRRHDELYSLSYERVGVMFAACPNFHDFYNESAINNNGLECLRFLNEIISDYDELLNMHRFSSIVKIKTVGPTYMAASGMVSQPNQSKGSSSSIQEDWKHLDDLVQFAFSMKEVLKRINEQSFNNFILRIGMFHGPVVAGVIGARKPHYDIWSNTVNVASRMESTGLAGKIQVVEETKDILETFGYYFEKRGVIKVKGKGELMTYFLEGQHTVDNLPNQVCT